jgi:hypothetical protein
MICPFCTSETSPASLVCSACSRDIAVPSSLIAERDGLAQKLGSARDELSKMREEIAALMRGTTHSQI